MEEIRDDPALELQVVATGMHLSPEFGSTERVIEEDGFTIDARVDMLLSSDTSVGAAKSIGVGTIAFADALARLGPDIMVVLGDRFELFSAVVPALMLGIPIAHIHGGETSQGAIDEYVRHAVTKLASIHFPATEAYRDRVIQMGEDASRVFACGAPGLDGLHRLTLMEREELERKLDFDLGGTVALVTYHPVTLEKGSASDQIDTILDAIGRSGVRAIFTKANADEQGRLINRKIRDFCEDHTDQYRFHDSLGTLMYLSCMRQCTLMVGNSSSGLVEAPSLRLPVVNIGDRQKGRIKAANVIDVTCSPHDILNGIATACSPSFREKLAGMKNPYDAFEEGGTSRRIKDILKDIDISDKTLKKEFQDLFRNGMKQ